MDGLAGLGGWINGMSGWTDVWMDWTGQMNA